MNKIMAKDVQPFTYAGIDVFDLDVRQLRNLLARALEVNCGFTFEWNVPSNNSLELPHNVKGRYENFTNRCLGCTDRLHGHWMYLVPSYYLSDRIKKMDRFANFLGIMRGPVTQNVFRPTAREKLMSFMITSHLFTLQGKSTTDESQCQKCGCRKEQHVEYEMPTLREN